MHPTKSQIIFIFGIIWISFELQKYEAIGLLIIKNILGIWEQEPPEFFIRSGWKSKSRYFSIDI